MQSSMVFVGDANARAAFWYARLQADDCSAADRSAFEHWCIEDPSHIDAWLAVSDVHEQAAQLRDDPALRASLRSARQQSSVPGWRRRGAGVGWAVAALMVLAVAMVGWQYRVGSSNTLRYATAVGEQKSITLEDGTSLVLDTDSVVLARLDGSRRQLEVERGRVSIDVASDPNRAFEVVAGAGRIRDIGTKFQVQRGNDGVTVTLIDGVVAISTDQSSGGEALLAPGQKLNYSADGSIGPVRPADLHSAQGWTRGQIILSNRPLDELLVELNRYSTTPLRLSDPADGKLAVSGVFNVDDRDALLRALEAGWGIKVSSRSASEIVLGRTR